MRNGYQRQYHEKKHRLHYSKALNKPAARKFMFTDKFVFIHKNITASKGTAHILFVDNFQKMCYEYAIALVNPEVLP